MSNDWAYVEDGIYISSAPVVDNNEFLTKHNIGLIVNASNRPQYVNNMEIPTIFAINYQDTVPGPFSIKKDTQILINKLNDISSVINMFMKQNPSANILIHCQAGINRSATIIAYYLIKYRGYDPKDIIKKNKISECYSAK